MPERTVLPAVAAHGATRLPSVDLHSYNIELKEDEGLIGDRASKGAFREIIQNWRKSRRENGGDPLGDDIGDDLSRKQLDELLDRGEPEAAGIVHGAVGNFSQELALVIRRYFKLKGWKDTQRVAIGGGFRASRVGELVIGRTSIILKADKIDIGLSPIHNDPDQAGLIGAAHLAPACLFEAYDAILGVDIGGTDIRAGVVNLNLKKDPNLGKAKVWKFSLWRHGDEGGVERRTPWTHYPDAERIDRGRRPQGHQARALHRHRLPGTDRGGWFDRARRAEPAGQLGEQSVQPSA
jgi:hypothetical protein